MLKDFTFIVLDFFTNFSLPAWMPIRKKTGESIRKEMTSNEKFTLLAFGTREEVRKTKIQIPKPYKVVLVGENQFKNFKL